MKTVTGKEKRKHFRLDLEKKTIDVSIKINENQTITGILNDVSNGGISFTLYKKPNVDLVDQTVIVSFVIEDRLFTFDMKILRLLKEKGLTCYAGEFVDNSKIKKSQLSLLLMKMKLISGETEII